MTERREKRLDEIAKLQMQSDLRVTLAFEMHGELPFYLPGFANY